MSELRYPRLSKRDRSRIFGEQQGAIERIAPGYFDPGLERDHLARYGWAVRSIGKTSDVILDLGCGTGYGSHMLMSGTSAKRVLSLDISADALQFAEDHYSGPTHIRADAHELPFSNNSVAAVVCLETIEHIHNPMRALHEAHRVLRPGGMLAISTPNRIYTDGTNPYHIGEFTCEELLQGLTEAAFTPLSMRGQHWQGEVRFLKLRASKKCLWETFGKSPRVSGFPLPSWASPSYWCVLATKHGA